VRKQTGVQAAPFGTMLKPTDLGNLDDDAFVGQLNFSGFR
jgi:hypothetical protein